MTGSLADPGVYPAQPIVTPPMSRKELLEGGSLRFLARRTTQFGMKLKPKQPKVGRDAEEISINLAFPFMIQRGGKQRAVGGLKVYEAEKAVTMHIPINHPSRAHIERLSKLFRRQGSVGR